MTSALQFAEGAELCVSLAEPLTADMSISSRIQPGGLFSVFPFCFSSCFRISCSELFLQYTIFSSLYLTSSSRSLRHFLYSARNCLLLLVLLVPAVLHIALFYLARQFSKEAKDCSENNITATNLVKSASRDFQYNRGEEEEQTTNGSAARKSKLEDFLRTHARA